MPTLYEYLDLIASQRGLTVEAWNMFIGVHIAFIGGLFAVRRRLFLSERLIAGGIYIAFMIVNFRAQFDNYTLLKEFITAAGTAEEALNSGQSALITDSVYALPMILPALPAIYACAALCMLLVIALINLISRKQRQAT